MNFLAESAFSKAKLSDMMVLNTNNVDFLIPPGTLEPGMNYLVTLTIFNSMIIRLNDK